MEHFGADGQEFSNVSCICEDISVEDVVRIIFESCDIGDTNTVRVSTVIRIVSPFVKNEDWIELLKIDLDPDGLDLELTREEYYKGMSLWTQKLCDGSSREQNACSSYCLRASTSQDKKLTGFGQSTPRSNIGEELVKIYVLNSSSGGSSTSSTPKRKVADADATRSRIEERLIESEHRSQVYADELFRCRTLLHGNEDAQEKLQKDLVELRKELAHEKEVNEGLTREINDYEELRETLLKANGNIEEFQRRLSSANKEIAELKKNLSQLDVEKQSSENQNAILESKIAEQNRLLLLQTNELYNRDKEVCALEDEKAELTTHLSDAEKNLQFFKEKAEILECEKDNIKKVLCEIAKRKQTKQSNALQLQTPSEGDKSSSCSSFIDNNSWGQEEFGNLLSYIAMSPHTSLQAEMSQVDPEVTEGFRAETETGQNVQAESDTVIDDVEVHKLRITELTKENTDLSQRIEQLTPLEDLVKDYEELKKQKSLLEEANNNNNSQIQQLSEEIKQLIANQDSKHGEWLRMEDTVRMYESELRWFFGLNSAKHLSKDVLRELGTNAREKLHAAEMEIAQLQQKLNDTNETYSGTYLKQVEEFMGKFRMLREELGTMNSDMTVMKTGLLVLEKECANVGQLNHKIDSLKSDVGLIGKNGDTLAVNLEEIELRIEKEILVIGELESKYLLQIERNNDLERKLSEQQQELDEMRLSKSDTSSNPSHDSAEETMGLQVSESQDAFSSCSQELNSEVEGAEMRRYPRANRNYNRKRMQIDRMAEKVEYLQELLEAERSKNQILLDGQRDRSSVEAQLRHEIVDRKEYCERVVRESREANVDLYNLRQSLKRSTFSFVKKWRRFLEGKSSMEDILYRIDNHSESPLQKHIHSPVRDMSLLKSEVKFSENLLDKLGNLEMNEFDTSVEELQLSSEHMLHVPVMHQPRPASPDSPNLETALIDGFVLEPNMTLAIPSSPDSAGDTMANRSLGERVADETLCDLNETVVQDSSHLFESVFEAVPSFTGILHSFEEEVDNKPVTETETEERFRAMVSTFEEEAGAIATKCEAQCGAVRDAVKGLLRKLRTLQLQLQRNTRGLVASDCQIDVDDLLKDLSVTFQLVVQLGALRHEQKTIKSINPFMKYVGGLKAKLRSLEKPPLPRRYWRRALNCFTGGTRVEATLIMVLFASVTVTLTLLTVFIQLEISRESGSTPVLENLFAPFLRYEYRYGPPPT